MSFGINATITRVRSKLDIGCIFFLIAGVVLFHILPSHIFSPIFIFVLGLALGLLMITILAPEDFNFLFKLYMAGFFLRVLLSLLFFNLAFIFKGDESNGFFFSNDGWCYSEQGWQLYQFAQRGIYIKLEEFLSNSYIEIMSGTITPYDYFNSFVYSFTGKSPLSLFFINSIAGSIAAVFIYLIAKELFSKKVARISSLFAFFWPSFIMWSTQNLKDSIIAMLIFILLWAIFYSYKKSFYVFLAISVLSAWWLYKLSLAFFGMTMVSLFFSAVFLFFNHFFKNRLVTIFVMGFLCAIVIIILSNSVLSMVFGQGFFEGGYFSSIFEFFDYHRSVRAAGNLQFLKNVDLSSPGRLLFFAPIGFLCAILAPFPWQIRSAIQILALPETIIFYLLLPVTIRGIIFSYRKRFNRSLVLLSIILFMLFFLGLVEGNAGTLFRHRSVAFYLLFIFTSVGMSLKDGKTHD
ncbi:glycosyltransferase family 39 protein [Candidatus Omnitrophota bacterium]